MRDQIRDERASWISPTGYRERGGSYSADRHERGMFERASDEVASWFGDRDAEMRREIDHRGRGPKGYRRSDERIHDDVSDKLADDRYVDASDVEVSVAGGEVMLTGVVDSRDAKRRAEDIAEQISGVSYVQNNLRVRDRQGRKPATSSFGVAERSAAGSDTLARVAERDEDTEDGRGAAAGRASILTDQQH